MTLPRGFKLAEQGRPIHFVYFPVSGLASIIRRTSKVWQEVGVFGREGAGSIGVISGNPVAPTMIVMQIEGTGFRVPSNQVVQAFEQSDEIRAMLLGYAGSLMAQVVETAVSNTQFNVVQRLARWLLMAQDRISSCQINLTHDYLSLMLGVSRTGVTLALKVLETTGRIEQGRSLIVIKDRSGLIEMIGDLYTPMARELPV